ncbi:sulfatase-like hydrolase/transferase [Paenibacillus sp. CC-CFT747]|nr:sulfatase-like hydrolase/transferase [Paenibacillus sp. CC-CFT747]
MDPLPVEETRTHRTAALAIEAMKKLTEGTGPWQLRVNFTEPHLPCRPAEEFAALYSPEEIPPWESFAETFEGKPYIQGQQLRNWKIEELTWEDWAPAVARYYAVITQLDDAVGRVLKALEDAGQKEQTMVVFTSDHGDMAGGHRMIDKHYVMYDDVVRVPFLVRWPGVIPPGSRSDAFVYPFLDLPPTLLDLAGAPYPEGAVLAGRSLLPLWTGEGEPSVMSSPEGWREEVVSTYNGQQFGLFSQRMLRTRDWKYVWNPTDTDELYDLKNDPHELNNVVRMPENHRRAQELRRRLYDILLKEGDGLVSTSWMRDQLMEGLKK